MKKLIASILLLCSLSAVAQQERVVVTTSPLARQLLTNTTAASWLAILGLGQASNIPTMGPAQIIVGNAAGNPTAFNVTGVLTLDTNGVWSLNTNGVIAGPFLKGVVGADGRVTSISSTLAFTDIPSLPGSIIGSGTVLAARLPANIAFQDGNNTFTGVDNFTGTTLINGTNINTLFGSGGGGGGGGSVTSVGLSMPAQLFSSVLNTPVTTVGTLTPVLSTQTSNTFFRGPLSGGAATPSWGPLVNADFGPGLLNAASNIWTGIQYFNGGANFTASNLNVNGTASMNNVTVSNLLTATNINTNVVDFKYMRLDPIAGAFGLTWSNGLFTCIQDQGPGFPTGLWINSTHGTDYGNGTEWQFTANQVGEALTDGNHHQFGAAQGTIGSAFTLNGMGGQSSTYSASAILNWKARYGPGVALTTTGAWMDTWDPTNGYTTLHWYTGGQNTWTGKGGDIMKMDFDGGVEFDDYVRFGYTNDSALVSSTNYGINLTNQTFVELHMATNLNLYETNLNLEGHITNGVDIPKHIIIDPDFGSINLSTPTNWPSITVDIGVATNAAFPTTVTNGMKMIIDLDYTLSSQTNRYVGVRYQPYTFALDPDAARFLTATGTTNLTEKSAINQLVISLKANNVWTNIFDFIYPFIGSTSNSTKWNLCSTNYTIIWNGAPAAFTFNSFGVAGNGSTSYGDTGFNPVTATNPLYTNFVLNSAQVGFYSKFNPGFSGGTGAAPIGFGFNGGSTAAFFNTTAGTATNATTINGRGPNDNATLTTTFGTGFEWLWTTNSATDFFVSGVNSSSTAASHATISSQNMYVLAINSGGAVDFSTNLIALAWGGGGPSATQQSAISNIFTTFLQQTGRQ